MTIYVVRRTVRRVSEAITTHFRNSRCSCVTLCLRSAQSVRYLYHNRRGRIVTNAATLVYPHVIAANLNLFSAYVTRSCQPFFRRAIVSVGNCSSVCTVNWTDIHC